MRFQPVSQSPTPKIMLVASLVAATLSAQDEVVKAPELVIIGDRPTGLFQAKSDTTIEPTYSTSLWGELNSRVPNVHISDSGSGGYGSLTSVRGLTNTPYFGDPALTLYVNDIPLAGAASVPTVVPGMWSASWVRGPQAAFQFGRATTGGTLLLDSFRSLRGFQGSARVFYGDFDLLGFSVEQHAAAGALDVQANVVYSERDGYIENTTLKQDVDAQDQRAVAARVRYQATSNVELSLQYFGSRARSGSQPLVPLGGPLYTVQRDREGATGIDFNGLAFKAVAVTPLATVTSVTSYTDWEMNPYSNTLALGPDFTFDSAVEQRQDAFNQEFRLNSLSTAKFPWSAGLIYSRANSDGEVSRSIMGNVPIEASNYTVKHDNVALFGQSTLMAEDGWSFDAGVRAEYNWKRFTRQETVPGNNFFRSSFGTTRIVPRATATVLLNPDSKVSLSWSAGYKPGGFSSFTSDRALSRFNAEQTKAWELSWERRLSRTATLIVRGYNYDTENFQIERSFTPTDYLVVNAPKARSRGVEVESVFAIGPQLSVNVAAGWQDSILRSFTDPFSGDNFSRKSTPYAPRGTARVEAIYTPLPGWELRASATRTGRIYYDESENIRYSQSQYDLVAASLAYTRGNWRAAVSGQNLTDERYYSLIVPGVEHGVPGAPRTWRLEVGYSW